MSINIKSLSALALAGALTLAWVPSQSLAQDAEIAKQEAAVQEEAKQPGYVESLKLRYNLTDEQVKKLRDAGMNDSQMTITAHLAAASGKTLDEVAKMRTEDKMGWGKIAKTLGIHPREIGKGMSGMHKSDKAAVNEAKAAVKEHKAEAKEHKAEAKAERAQMKAERAQMKAERKAGKNKE